MVDGAWSERDWQAFLSAQLGCDVEVRYGRARTSVVRVVTRASVRVVHLNAVFAEAPANVRQALAGWLRSGRRARRATAELDAWIQQRVAALHVERPARITRAAQGRHHDLAALAAELHASEFSDSFATARAFPRITWGRFASRRARRSLRLGSFEPLARIVRVHPVLDSPAVPSSFVRYVLFHELLHAVVDEGEHGRSRRVLHGPEFRRRERAFAGTSGALRWERENIDALLRAARARVPLPASSPRRRARPLSRALAWVQRSLFDG